ncbi:hypothetical protein U1Q18_005843 [Sarracenia purpurea var. burkii]
MRAKAGIRSRPCRKEAAPAVQNKMISIRVLTERDMRITIRYQPRRGRGVEGAGSRFGPCTDSGSLTPTVANYPTFSDLVLN